MKQLLVIGHQDLRISRLIQTLNHLTMIRYSIPQRKLNPLKNIGCKLLIAWAKFRRRNHVG